MRRQKERIVPLISHRMNIIHAVNVQNCVTAHCAQQTFYATWQYPFVVVGFTSGAAAAAAANGTQAWVIVVA